MQQPIPDQSDNNELEISASAIDIIGTTLITDQLTLKLPRMGRRRKTFKFISAMKR